MASNDDGGPKMLRSVLGAAEPRPSAADSQDLKNKYAIRFAEEAARSIAEDLQPRLKGIRATTKREATSTQGKKQLDINFSTPHLGLAVGISLKSVHIREAKGAKRYTHNMKRNEEELRIEATGYHKRQPYAVMIAVLWLPFDSCDDGITGASSFGSWVRHLRPYTGRSDARDDPDRFERIYLGLYEPDGGDLRFFDVEADPPKRGRPSMDGKLFGSDGRPRRLLTYAEFLHAVEDEYLRRNHANFRWADAGEEPLSAEDLDSVAGDEE